MVKFETVMLDTPEDAAASGFATFNNNPHLCIDLPDGATTLSLRTSDGRRVTFAFMPYHRLGAPECCDIAYHDNGTSRVNNGGTTIPTFDVLAFGPANKGKDWDSRKERPAPEDKPGIICLLMDTAETKEKRLALTTILPKATK